MVSIAASDAPAELEVELKTQSAVNTLHKPSTEKHPVIKSLIRKTIVFVSQVTENVTVCVLQVLTNNYRKQSHVTSF